MAANNVKSVKNTFKRKKPHEVYMERVRAVKNRVPKNWRDQLFELYPDLNTAKGLVFVNNVFHGKSSDATVTEFLEKIAI